MSQFSKSEEITEIYSPSCVVCAALSNLRLPFWPIRLRMASTVLSGSSRLEISWWVLRSIMQRVSLFSQSEALNKSSKSNSITALTLGRSRLVMFSGRTSTR